MSMDDRKTESPPKPRGMVRLPKCKSLGHSEIVTLVHIFLSPLPLKLGVLLIPLPSKPFPGRSKIALPPRRLCTGELASVWPMRTTH